MAADKSVTQVSLNDIKVEHVSAISKAGNPYTALNLTVTVDGEDYFASLLSRKLNKK